MQFSSSDISTASNIAGLVIGIAGLGYGLWQDRQRRIDRAQAFHEIKHIYSQLFHLQWWIERAIHSDIGFGRTPRELGLGVVAQLHQLAITLKSNAARYSSSELTRIEPHPVGDPVFKPARSRIGPAASSPVLMDDSADRSGEEAGV